jgi:hypothetical protein
MASSAAFRRLSILPLCGYKLIPMLADAWAGFPSMLKGVETEDAIFLAIFLAFSGVFISLSKATNSSPPKRAMTSFSRVVFLKR